MGDFSADLEKTISKFGKEVQQFVERVSEELQSEDTFRPLADVIETEEEFKIVLDLPGCTKEELKIALKNSVITISGDRNISTTESEVIKKRERLSGVFSRSFALPEDVNTAEIQANFKNGVLTVALPKSSVLKDSTNIKID